MLCCGLSDVSGDAVWGRLPSVLKQLIQHCAARHCKVYAGYAAPGPGDVMCAG